MVDEGLIEHGRGGAPRHRRPARPADVPAVRRVGAERTLLATGMNASPGAAVGKAVFDSDTAVEWAERGEDVILVRKETNPDDLRGMVAARGILTSRGGKTSHAAVVARGMGRTCVCGAEALDVDAKAKEFRVRDGETDPRGRRDLDRRHHRRGVRRRGAGLRLAGRAPLRGREDRRRPGRRRVAGSWRTPTAPAGCGCAPTPTPPTTPARARRFGAAGHRAVPDRAHVPRRPARAGRAADRRRGRGRARPRRWTRCCRCSGRTSPRSSRRWTGCR